jgi:hypothetical protein
MKIANYSIKASNYNQRRPEKLKRIADILLASVLAVNPILLTIPDFNGKEWLLFGWNMFVTIFKLITKLISESDVYHNP